MTFHVMKLVALSSDQKTWESHEKKPSRAKDEDWRTEIMTSAKWSLNMNWHFGFSEHFSFPDARGVWKIIFSSKYIRPSGWSDECLDSLWIFSAQWWFQVIRWTRLWHGTVPPSNPMMEDMDHHGSSWITMFVCHWYTLTIINHIYIYYIYLWLLNQILPEQFYTHHPFSHSAFSVFSKRFDQKRLKIGYPSFVIMV